MYVSRIKERYRKLSKKRICQGDLFSNLKVTLGAESNEENVALNINLMYGVVMTQDCDLEWDFEDRSTENSTNNDKRLNTILVCPAYPAEHFFLGTHVENQQMRVFPKQEAKKVEGNNTFDRYHFIKGNQDLQIPDLVIDYKHYITILSDAMYQFRKTAYKATLSELFRERLSQRFANYISRIGLPNLTK